MYSRCGITLQEAEYVARAKRKARYRIAKIITMSMEQFYYGTVDQVIAFCKNNHIHLTRAHLVNTLRKYSHCRWWTWKDSKIYIHSEAGLITGNSIEFDLSPTHLSSCLTFATFLHNVIRAGKHVAPRSHLQKITNVCPETQRKYEKLGSISVSKNLEPSSIEDLGSPGVFMVGNRAVRQLANTYTSYIVSEKVRYCKKSVWSLTPGDSSVPGFSPFVISIQYTDNPLSSGRRQLDHSYQ